MKDLETIEQAIILLKSIKSTYKKKERLSEKARNTKRLGNHRRSRTPRTRPFCQV